MPIERYYTTNPLLKDMPVVLKDKEFHHLAHVMRGKPGQHFELVNGKGVLAQAVVHELKKTEVILQITDLIKEPVSLPQFILAQALPKMNRLEFIIEKGTELGVDDFWLFPGSLSVKEDLSVHQVERLQLIAIAAMKQCGRLHLPSITLKPPLKQWQRQPFPLFFGDLQEKAPTWNQLFTEKKSIPSNLVFITGPESGFSLEELNHLQAIGAQGLKLHPHILRTDTASLVAATLFKSFLA